MRVKIEKLKSLAMRVLFIGYTLEKLHSPVTVGGVEMKCIFIEMKMAGVFYLIF